MPTQKGITYDEVIEAVQATQPAGTSDIAEYLGIEWQGADHRLRQLRDEGNVESDKIGGSLMWTL